MESYVRIKMQLGWRNCEQPTFFKYEPSQGLKYSILKKPFLLFYQTSKFPPVRFGVPGE